MTVRALSTVTFVYIEFLLATPDIIVFHCVLRNSIKRSLSVVNPSLFRDGPLENLWAGGGGGGGRSTKKKFAQGKIK